MELLIHESFAERLFFFYVSSCLFIEGMQCSKFYSAKTFLETCRNDENLHANPPVHTLRKKEMKGC